MAELGKFFVTIGSKLDAKGLDATIKKINEVEKETENIRKGFIKVGAAMTAFAVAGGAAILNLTNEASKLEETTSKFNTVFAKQRELAEEWSKTLVKSYGVTTEQSKRFLGSIQDLLVPMGMQSDLAAKLSNEVVKLSVDLGSFNNMPTEKVMLDIQSALVGNFETMKKYGVVLNETVIKQEAVNTGVWSGKGLLDASTKAQVAYSLIVKGSTAALDDFNRTSEGYANQVKIMTAGIVDFKAKIGEKLIPTMKSLVGMVVSVTGLLQKMDSQTVEIIAKTLLFSTAIAGLLAPLALFIGYLPQLTKGFIQVKAAIIATRLATTKFFAVLLAHPFVAVTTALAALTLGLANYLDKMADAKLANAETGKTIQSLINMQKEEMLWLQMVATDAKATTEERTEALELYHQRSQNVRRLEAELEAAGMEKKIENAGIEKMTNEEILNSFLNKSTVIASATKSLHERVMAEIARREKETATNFRAFSDSLASAWAGSMSTFILEGGKASIAIKNIWDDIRRFVVTMISQMIAKWITFQILTGGFGMGGGIAGKLLGFQSGVKNFKGGLAMVGEGGPELVNLPKGSDVISAPETSRIMNSRGGDIIIKNDLSGAVFTEGRIEETLEQINKAVKDGVFEGNELTKTITRRASELSEEA